MQAPVWVYSERSGTLKYSKTDMPGLGYIPLTGGWNFVTISPEMNGKTFGEIRGTCNFEKIAFWDKSTQSWIVEKNRFTLRENENPESWNSYLFADSFNLGQGILLKVSSDCQLGTSGSSVTPPTIPN